VRADLGAARSFATFALLALVLGLAGCAHQASPRHALADGESALDADASALLGADETDPSLLVAEALEACESARVFWQQGDLEAALATLDLAYELMLQIPDDPSSIQQKEDLRHLISSRVVEIYRSRLATTAGLDSPIPVEINAHVEREIARFSGPERRFFLESYQRSGHYRPAIVRMLREAGLPEELSWLPLVESGFKTRALSSARALGMWQFISSTGTRYGLDRSQWIDERMDPEKSTGAAIAYLTDLHGMFGDWMLALASYNCGENRVMRLIRRQENGYLDRFWDLFGDLPQETARYVPRFVATLAIVRDPEKYGFELPELLPPLPTETVPVSRHVRLHDLERALGLEREILTSLNPELRRGTTPSETYALRVPAAVTASFDTTLAALASYVPPAEVTYARHRVRPGETLSTIARRYRTSIDSIVRVNHLRSRNQIRVGQHLKIPQRGISTAALSATGGARSYTVRRGDTITRIAEARNVPINSILAANGLSRSTTIYPGQVIRFPE
jgi:membrane-bound lytic murein transglycosylase D